MTVPGVKAPRSIESDVASRPTEVGVRAGGGAGEGPNSVGRRETELSSFPQEGQKRPEPESSASQDGQRDTPRDGIPVRKLDGAALAGS